MLTDDETPPVVAGSQGRTWLGTQGSTVRCGAAVVVRRMGIRTEGRSGSFVFSSTAPLSGHSVLVGGVQRTLTATSTLLRAATWPLAGSTSSQSVAGVCGRS